jgi:MFS family permease
MVTPSHKRRNRPVGPSYKWIALSNTTLGVLMASIDISIVLISLPAIFNGIHINPLAPGETNYFLWLLLGYMVVTATLLVTFGRISDMLGRVRLYNMGFLIFACGSILLWLTPGTGSTGAIELIVFRLIQAVGAGFLFAKFSLVLFDLLRTVRGLGREPGEHFLIPAKVVVLLLAHFAHCAGGKLFKLSFLDLIN